MLFVLLTVPACTVCCRSTDHRTLHSNNACIAFYTLSVGALVKSCAKMLDCTEQPDGSYRLDAMPDVVCWEDIHAESMAPAAACFGFLYCIYLPFALFHDLRRSAKDGNWTPDELEKHAWVILKVRSASLNRSGPCCSALTAC